MKGSWSIVNEQLKKWVGEAIDRRVEQMEVQSMVGGISANIYQVGDYVVKNYVDLEWLADEPDLVVHEVTSLRQAEQGKLRVPAVIAYDETGEKSGTPSIIMEKLIGKPLLTLYCKEKFVEGLARTLAAIHAIEVSDFPWQYALYSEMSKAKIPQWGSDAKTWEKAIALANEPMPDVAYHFIHRDFHPTNILWQEEEVSGVVDWVNACLGPAGIDVGHCRVNLALLHGVEMADEFLNAYCLANPQFTYEAYFDMIAILDFIDGPLTVYRGWTDLGMSGLTDQLMEERMDALMESVIAKTSK